MRYFTLLLLVFPVDILFSQNLDSLAIIGIIEHRVQQQQTMLHPENSPLPEEERIKFRGLNYYDIDLNYRLIATFRPVKKSKPFKMQINTDRRPVYVKYGELRFSLDGKNYKLNVYQNPEVIKRAGYEEYLFIPFTDDTNGDETYPMGRYLDFRIPGTTSVVLDFNLGYNPYCHYNDKFSCPVPPVENNLPVKIKAGEKLFFDKNSGN